MATVLTMVLIPTSLRTFLMPDDASVLLLALHVLVTSTFLLIGSFFLTASLQPKGVLEATVGKKSSPFLQTNPWLFSPSSFPYFSTLSLHFTFFPPRPSYTQSSCKVLSSFYYLVKCTRHPLNRFLCLPEMRECKY